MSTPKHLLVPFDFSECSLAALDRAVELAQAIGGDVHLLYVAPFEAYAAPPFLPAVPVALSSDERARLEQGLTDVASARSKSGVAVSSTVVEGIVHDQIHRAAADMGADMIVMGTHGRTGLGHLLIGSITERVVRTSRVPVLTVPPPQKK